MLATALIIRLSEDILIPKTFNLLFIFVEVQSETQGSTVLDVWKVFWTIFVLFGQIATRKLPI